MNNIPYAITVTAIGITHSLDAHVEGVYMVYASSEDHALNIFHQSVPVTVLDDFEINASIVKNRI